MKAIPFLRPLALAVGLALGASCGGPTVPAGSVEIELSGFTQTAATSVDDLFGRALLLEFFAYW